MKNIKKNIRNRSIALSILLILICISVMLLQGSTAYLATVNGGVPETQVSINSCASINFSDSGNSIVLDDVYPVTDLIGETESDAYDFYLTNDCEEDHEVTVFFVANDVTTIDPVYIKTYLSEDNETGVIQKLSDYEKIFFEYDFYEQYNILTSSTASDIYQLGTYTVAGNSTVNLSLKLWVDIETPNSLQLQNFEGTIVAADEGITTGGASFYSNPDLCNSESTFEVGSIQEKIIENAGGVNCAIPNFSNISVLNDGIYQTEDVYGTTYYFRGAVENNWVYFADSYFRIVRINGDKSIKLIYADEDNISSVFNEDANTLEYVGNTNLQSSDSSIKGIIDTWYETNIENTGLSKYVADTAYCIDGTSFYDKEGQIINSKDEADYYYTSYVNLKTKKNPSLLCSSMDDYYTVSELQIGNGELKYPIALISSNEVAYAGGVSEVENLNFYLNTNQNYWTIDPYSYENDIAYLVNINANGSINSQESTVQAVARPVLSLASHVYLTGTGTLDDPYKLEN